MKKVLIIANHSTSLSSARGIQAHRLINELAKNLEIHLLTTFKSIPDEKSYFDNPLKSIIRFKEIPRRFKGLVGKLWLYFNVKDIYWYLQVIREAEKKIKNESIFTVLTFSMNLSNADVGYRLKKKYPQLQWISFYSDPISLNHYIASSFWQKRILKNYELKLFKFADKVIFPSKTMEIQYSNLYPDLLQSFQTIPHNFQSEVKNHPQDIKNNNFIVRHIGSLTFERSPIPLIEVILSNEDFFRNNNIKFEFIGNVSIKLRKNLAKYNNEIIKFIKPIPFKMVENKILESNLLLVIDANIKDSPFLPSKLIECMAYHIPIVGLTPIGSETERVLNDTNHFVLNYTNTEKIIEIIEKVKTEPQSFKNIEAYNITSIAKCWMKLIGV